MQREFHFTDRHFQTLRWCVREHTGITLTDQKRELCYGRLARRLRSLRLSSFDAYCDLIVQGDRAELTHFINAVTTNLTAFFREPHHFEYLGQTVLPELYRTARERRLLRIWSAGCSSGEEPYSIAMVVCESLPAVERWDVRILATDIDSDVLGKAEAGVYQAERVAGISGMRLRRWFARGTGTNAGLVKITDRVRDLVTFRRLNLLQHWPMTSPFDVIFCRNVVIYFDKPTQMALFDRMGDMLAARGHLIIGHSESLFRISDRFECVARTTYRKLR